MGGNGKIFPPGARPDDKKEPMRRPRGVGRVSVLGLLGIGKLEKVWLPRHRPDCVRKLRPRQLASLIRPDDVFFMPMGKLPLGLRIGS